MTEHQRGYTPASGGDGGTRVQLLILSRSFFGTSDGKTPNVLSVTWEHVSVVFGSLAPAALPSKGG